MQLNQSTDLALRILMRIAVADPGSALTTRSVATQMRVSYAHAAKVVARLEKLGTLTTSRGRGGGLAITEYGRSASVGALVRELEGAKEVVECEGDAPCPLRDACRLRGVLRQAQEAFFAQLDPHTVADLTAAPTGGVLISLGERLP